MLRLDYSPRRAHRDRALNFILQLTDVSRPPVLAERVERFRTELDVWLRQALRGVAQEERAQMRDFFKTFPQRRHMNADDAEAVVEILAELAFGDALFEIR